MRTFFLKSIALTLPLLFNNNATTGQSLNICHSGANYERVLVGIVRTIVCRGDAASYPDAVNAMLGLHSNIRGAIAEDDSVDSDSEEMLDESQTQKPNKEQPQNQKLHHDQLLCDALLELKMGHLVSIEWYDLLQKEGAKGLTELWSVTTLSSPSPPLSFHPPLSS